jgi:hypothetical protein
MLLLIGVEELRALVTLYNKEPAKKVAAGMADSVEQIKRLLDSGIQKNVLKAADLGMAAATAAGLGAGRVGAAIGTVLFPGIGTIVGGLLGGMLAGTDDDKKEK